MSSSLVDLTPPEQVAVLLVDDTQNLLALQEPLKAIGGRVVLADSGAEALRLLDQDDFAVILLGMKKPSTDGFETAKRIRAHERSAQTPIIFLSATDADEAQASQVYALGAVDCVRMPVPPELLRAKVAVFVDLFRKTQQVQKQAESLRAAREREFTARLADAALRLDLEARRNRFFTLAVDMLGILGFDGHFLQLSPSWERTLGFSESELREARFTQLLHPMDCEAAEAQLKGLAEGAPTARFESRHLHRDGSYRWLAWTAVPFAVEGVAYVFVRDVSETREAEAARLHLLAEQEARRAAQRENEIKDEFLATLSHELRAPLTPILGWTAMLRSGRLGPAETARGLEVIHRNVKLQSQLMDDLLEVSRIVSGKLRLELRPMELAPVIEAGLDGVRPLAAAKHLHLTLALVGGGLQVMGDPGRLQQVVWNLVANAVKFTPEGGHVDIVLSLDQGQARLSVSDSGIGISPEFLPHIFDRFRQAETGASRAHGGLGLGLTIVRHLVEAHGGSVCAESDGLGKGARFVVSLPSSLRMLPSRAPEPTGAGTPREAALVLQGLDLLLVDDDPEVCELLGLSLRQHGAEVRWASSAAEALEHLDATPPDVLVSDIGMPGTDGYALIEQVRQREPERGGRVPAIALTAYASGEEVARARAAGFQLHLAKPVDPERVLQAVLALAPTGH